jgi:hypothetical protein
VVTARRAALGRLAVAGALALGLGACSSSARSGAPTTGAVATTTTMAPGAAAGTVVPGPGASTVVPTAATTTTGAGTTVTTVVPTTVVATGALAHPTSGMEFLSPSGNLSCQIDNGPPFPDQSAYCQSVATDTSATLGPDGVYRTCHNRGCLGNPAPNIPVLAYGQSVTLGPFTCSSATDGMTCVAAGKGFLISRAGVAAVPA